jgi:hypothetical protein
VSADASPGESLSKARRLAEDLNLSTLGWRIPSHRLIEDFAAGEHGLRAQEHQLTDVDRSGEPRCSRRAFSLFPLDADTANVERIALLVEPESGGAWRLLVPDGG